MENAYLPLDCPKCGMGGRVSFARLNRRFRCRNCRHSFYIDRTGKIAAAGRLRVVAPPSPELITTRRRVPTGRLGLFVQRVPKSIVLGICAVTVMSGAIPLLVHIMHTTPVLPSSLL